MKLTLITLLGLLTASCNTINPDNPSILRFSKGKAAGVFSSWFVGQGDYCQLTSSTPDYSFTEVHIAFLEERCPEVIDGDELILDILTRP